LVDPPDGLQWTLNNLQSTKYFALDSADSEDTISRILCCTIEFYNVAPIALVENGNHWVVVHGYTASARPSSFGDLSYTISSFDINDPWPPTPTPGPPPPHSDGDVCGTGGARGVASSNVSYNTWREDYMTANQFGAQWLGKYVAVCDPHPPPLVKAIRARVQSLANSLAARDPDHFLWGRTHKADNGRVLVIEYEVHG
jgi:hypothetical protein